MNVGVCYLGRRIDRVHVAIAGLDRWPMHGFDGRTLTIVRLVPPPRRKKKAA